MVNFVQMITDIIQEVNDFKKENLDALQKSYNEKMSKVAEVEKQISEIPNTCAGKSQVFIDKKRKQLNEKLEKLTKTVNDWFNGRKKQILEQMEAMLTAKKDAVLAAQKDAQDQFDENTKMITQITAG